MFRSRLFASLLSIALVGQGTLAPLHAQESRPYFRFNLGQDRGKLPAVDTDPGDLAEPLRFVRSGTLPGTLPVGQSVRIPFGSTGGGPTHSLAPFSMVPGLVVTQQGPREWVLQGVLSQTGTYGDAGVRLADGTSAPVDLRIGSIAVTPRPSPQTLQFTAAPSIPSPMQVGQAYDGTIRFKGGSGQGENIVGNGLPPGFDVYNDGVAWHLSGYAQVAGTYPAPSYTLTDDAGASVTHTMTDVVVTEEPAGDALRFQTIVDLPASIPYGEWGQAYYGLAGGSPPYRLTIRNLPARFAATPLSHTMPMASDWMVEGPATIPGTYPGILVTVTDDAGKTISRTMDPVTVEDVAAKPLAFSMVEDPQGPVPAQASVQGRYGATGGVGPYTMTVLDAPSLVLMRNGSDDWSEATAQGEAWRLTGAVEDAGTYRGVRVRLADSTGASVEHAFDLEVVAGPSQKLAFAGTQDIPANIDASYSANLAYSAKGGAGNGYYMTLVNGPTGLSVESDTPSDVAGTSFHLKGKPEQFGTFADAFVRLEDAASNQVLHRLPAFTVAKTGIQPLAVVREIASGVRSVYRKDDPFSALGKVEGGVKPYFARFTGGGPLEKLGVGYSPFGFPGPDAEATDDNVKVYADDDPALGTRTGIVVKVTDSAGASVQFQPFSFRFGGLPLAGCNLGESTLLAARPGETATLTLRWSGGQAPYTFAFEGVPKELGVTATSATTYTADLRMEPTGSAVTAPGSMVTVTDSEGSTCGVELSADSTSGTSSAGLYDYPMPVEGRGVTVGVTQDGEPLYTLSRGQIIGEGSCLASERPNCAWLDSNAHIGVMLSLSTEDMTRFLVPDVKNFGWSYAISGSLPVGLMVTTPFCRGLQVDRPSQDPTCGPRFDIGVGPTNYESLQTSGIHRFRILASRDGEVFSTRWINVQVGN